MTEPKPCPFCGCPTVTVVEGSTFRWRVAECDSCDARCGEVRIQTVGDGTQEEWEADAKERAIEEWNRRA
jgi:Lar family restriction alleviation protein